MNILRILGNLHDSPLHLGDLGPLECNDAPNLPLESSQMLLEAFPQVGTDLVIQRSRRSRVGQERRGCSPVRPGGLASPYLVRVQGLPRLS
jgi:hypothetical protein